MLSATCCEINVGNKLWVQIFLSIAKTFCCVCVTLKSALFYFFIIYTRIVQIKRTFIFWGASFKTSIYPFVMPQCIGPYNRQSVQAVGDEQSRYKDVFVFTFSFTISTQLKSSNKSGYRFPTMSQEVTFTYIIKQTTTQ